MRRDMDEDINWGKLFLKVIFVFVIVLLIIWIFSKFILRDSNNDINDSFDKNLDKMYDVAEEYFSDKDRLPVLGEDATITLGDMIEKGLIDSIKDGDDVCSTKSSYAKVSNKNGKYTLKVLLTCGSESDYISKVILEEKVKKEEDDNKEVDDNNSSSYDNSANDSTSIDSNGTSSSGSSSSNEVEKVVVDYTSLEYKFCKIGNSNYYTVIYLSNSDIKKGYETSYTILLSDLSNVDKLRVSDDGYFKYKSRFLKYIKNMDDNFSIVNGNSARYAIGNVNEFIKFSLKSSDFDYKLSDVYFKDGNYYIDINIKIKRSFMNSYSYNGNKINYVPIYFSLNYAKLDNCVKDTYSNSNKYYSYYVVK